jgi:hypothetical protein
VFDLNELKKILMERLEKKGIGPTILPGFIRNLVNTFPLEPDSNLPQIRHRLDLLGWDGFELDYRTLELVTACLEPGWPETISDTTPIQ